MCKTSLSVIHRQRNRKTQLKVILKLKEYSYEDPRCITGLTEGLWFFLPDTCKEKKKRCKCKIVCECIGAHPSGYISGHSFRNEVQGELLVN